MTNFYKWLSRRGLAWLIMLLTAGATLGGRAAWAQGSTAASSSSSSGGSGGNAPVCEEGYSITGEPSPKPGTDYVYEGQAPETDREIYWSVQGASKIEGRPATEWPEGSLPLSKFHTLRVEWQDSVVFGRLALRYVSPPANNEESVQPPGQVNEPALWYIPLIIYATVEYFCFHPEIQWSRGSFSGSQYESFPRDQSPLVSDICIMDVQNLRFRATWGFPCSQGPRPYRWQFTYITEQGHAYVEAWTTSDDEIFKRFYPQVPQYPFAAPGFSAGNLQPAAYGSFTSSTAPVLLTTYNPGTVVTNPYANEKITRVRIRVTGQGCGPGGICGTLDVSTATIVLQFLPPTGVTAQEILANNQLGASISAGQGLCAGRRYQLSAEPSPGEEPKSYDWTSDVGSITAAGLTATLDLRQVTATTAPLQVNIGVSARRGDPPCITPSSPATFAFNFRETAQPQNLHMDDNSPICSTPTTRTIRVNQPTDPSVTFDWTVVSGPGSFSGYQNTNGQSFIDLTFTGLGLVTVEVKGHDDCNRASAPVTASFRAANPTATPDPLPVDLLGGYNQYPWSSNPRVVGQLPIRSPQSGVTYTIQLTGVEAFTLKGSGATYYPGDPKASVGANYPNYVHLGTNSTGTTTVTILRPEVASITVLVTARNGCGTGASPQTRSYTLARPPSGSGFHRVVAADGGAEDENPDADAAPRLYPNPTSGELQVVAPSPATRYERVLLLNAQGAVVQDVQAAEGVQHLSLKDLPAGIYAVRLFDGERFVTQRVAKE